MSIAENQETRRLGPQLNGIAMTAEEFDAAGECEGRGGGGECHDDDAHRHVA